MNVVHGALTPNYSNNEGITYMPAFNIIYQPYTYLVGWSEHNLWYYGVRYANKTIPEDDLWVKYFTSSSSVRKLRKDLGEPDVIDIRQKFDSPEKAILWEKTVLRRSNVLNDSKWLNKNIGGATYPVHGENNPNYGGNKGKDNPMYGKSHSKDTLLLLSEANKGKPRSEESKRKQSESVKGENNHMYGKTRSEETRKKHSESIKGENNGMYGKTHSEEAKRKISESKKGKPQEKVTCPHCKKVGGITVMKRWHFDNCKKKSIIITRIM